MASQEILITGLLLRAIPEALQSEEFSHITTLDVSENSLERLDGLEFLINLKRLSASSNKLSSLSVVSKLEQLEELFAAENNLVEVLFFSFLFFFFENLVIDTRIELDPI